MFVSKMRKVSLSIPVPMLVPTSRRDGVYFGGTGSIKPISPGMRCGTICYCPLLIRHDYTADVIGTWAKAAHIVLEHGVSDGVAFSKRRRVTPRGSDGAPKGGPLLIGIDIDEWRLV